jgi:hypothetical protein
MSMAEHRWAAENGVSWYFWIPVHALSRVQRYWQQRGYAADAGEESGTKKSRLVHFYPVNETSDQEERQVP